MGGIICFADVGVFNIYLFIILAIHGKDSPSPNGEFSNYLIN